MMNFILSSNLKVCKVKIEIDTMNYADTYFHGTLSLKFNDNKVRCQYLWI